MKLVTFTSTSPSSEVFGCMLISFGVVTAVFAGNQKSGTSASRAVRSSLLRVFTALDHASADLSVTPSAGPVAARRDFHSETHLTTSHTNTLAPKSRPVEHASFAYHVDVIGVTAVFHISATRDDRNYQPTRPWAAFCIVYKYGRARTSR